MTFVTDFFLAFREFERRAMFTVKKQRSTWRELQVALMAIFGKDDDHEQVDGKNRNIIIKAESARRYFFAISRHPIARALETN